MVNVAMLIGGALVNALAFTGSSYLFHRLSADNINAKRKRHDAAIELGSVAASCLFLSVLMLSADRSW